MRTITSPGVEIKEIDRSQYVKTETGTKCFVMGFANKGEPYVPMEFSSRTAWLNYYGEPDNEAERYFFNACMEVMNQNGVLYCARLPYDNQARDKMVAHKYNVQFKKNYEEFQDKGYFHEIHDFDKSINHAYVIDSAETPYLVDTASVDAWRTHEEKVGRNNFVIVDKTCATYKMIDADSRKGQQREILGIVPVVTTAANALYTQSLIDVEPYRVKFYESLGKIDTLRGATGGILAGDATNPDDNDKSMSVLYNTDLVEQLNSVYKHFRVKYKGLIPQLETIGEINDTLFDCMMLVQDQLKEDTTVSGFGEIIDTYYAKNSLSGAPTEKIGEWPDKIDKAVDAVKAQMLEIAGELNSDSLSSEAKSLEGLRITSESTIGDCQVSVSKLYAYLDGYAGIHAEDGDDDIPETISQVANSFFNTIELDKTSEGFDRTHLKKIGIVVFKTYIDPSEGNKIAFEPVEAFVGSLYKDDVDPNTGMTTFIDTIVNDTSEYINVFSNCFNTASDKKQYIEECDMIVSKPTDNAASLGFYSYMTEEDISLDRSLYEGMNRCFDKVSDVNERDIDIVVDAGLANIGSFIKKVYGGKGRYDLNAMVNEATGATACSLWKINSNDSAVRTWKAVEQKLDNFCKNVRKDCMFIADGLRPLVIDGQKKIVRPSKPTNSIDANILPYVKFMTGLNTNYGAGYMDWFEVADEFTGDFFWCPPSIKAMGVYIYTDTYANYWDAPAGLNRGLVTATDVAFSPTAKQAGTIYEKNWNYAINYPTDGIVLEGQKTFQVKPSAFDRVNVRRLFLRLERQTFKVARYFVYEGNTAYTRQRLIDTLDPIFYKVKCGGGLYDYKLICDDKINDANTIDNSELKVKVGLKPTKTSEFILIDFYAIGTGGSWDEMN
jgi:hypothetical protein